MSRQLSYALIINLLGFAAVANGPYSLVFDMDVPDAIPLATPGPKGINSLCLDEWSRHKELIINKRDSLYDAIADKEKLSRNKEKAQHEINSLKARLSNLDKVIGLVNTLEKSDVEYILKPSIKAEGSTAYDTRRRCIVLTVGSTANFIHEITHGGQYEAGEIIFDSQLDKSYLQDLYDEVEAYKAQFAYDPSSVSSLKSSFVARSLADITPRWVEDLQSAEGEKTYRDHSKIRVNIYSGKAVLLMAYPQLASQFSGWADSWTMKEAPNVVYKRQPMVVQ
ncbi:hypothetical protein D3H65_28880 [Paraflavitalea soli]|uniref:Uncharacterized protein n=1 Tax=Paraflavitalea soli TaxID=2315862 RepID=A0A3B7MWC9_9BACT|nr:hypothetical protein [Paraflavitalea soli]AXY77753.1 hypothetical protein D3H65_28880 [Paraflavitalea soli]